MSRFKIGEIIRDEYNRCSIVKNIYANENGDVIYSLHTLGRGDHRFYSEVVLGKSEIANEENIIRDILEQEMAFVIEVASLKDYLPDKVIELLNCIKFMIIKLGIKGKSIEE